MINIIIIIIVNIMVINTVSEPKKLYTFKSYNVSNVKEVQLEGIFSTQKLGKLKTTIS